MLLLNCPRSPLLLQGTYVALYPSFRPWYSEAWVQMLPLAFSDCVVLGTFLTFCVTQHIEGIKVLTPLGCREELVTS